MSKKNSKRDWFFDHKIQKIAEKLEGGLADETSEETQATEKETDVKDIQEQKLKGAAVEMEHTDDPNAAEEKDLGDPDKDDKQIIVDFLATQEDLDDDTMHKLYETLGVDPHEGEELVYATVQKLVQENPDAVDAASIEEKEVEMDEKEAADQANGSATLSGYLHGYLNKQALQENDPIRAAYETNPAPESIPVPDAPESPEAPEADEAPEAPEMPEAPNMPEAPTEEVPGSAAKTAMPELYPSQEGAVNNQLVSPVQAARQMEAAKGDPASPLTNNMAPVTPTAPAAPALPTGWDVSSLSADNGNIA